MIAEKRNLFFLFFVCQSYSLGGHGHAKYLHLARTKTAICELRRVLHRHVNASVLITASHAEATLQAGSHFALCFCCTKPKQYWLPA